MASAVEMILEEFAQYITPENKKNSLAEIKENFAANNLSFDWIHTGKLAMPIAEIAHIITNNNIAPVRTGHLGNWQEIGAGRAGALDHNGTVCGASKLAHPLIADFNQTENETMTAGDVVYLPGSIVTKEKRITLPLFTWNGKKFVERSRAQSYFVPFVLAELEGELTPLSIIHRSHCQFYQNARFISSVTMANLDLVKEILQRTIEYISIEHAAALTLTDIIDRVVFLDGSVIREKISYNEGKYKLGDLVYANTEELINAILTPYQAAHNPQEFFPIIKTLPTALPCLTLAFSCVLDYVLNNYPTSEKEKTAPFDLYFEWGAFDSAGYPPRQKGYYKQKARLIKKIYELIIRVMPEIKPLFFILLPSAIFNILPNSAYATDAVYINELLINIIQASEKLKHAPPDILMLKIEQSVSQWFKQYKEALSPYYLSRFTKRRCIHQDTHRHEYGTAMHLPEFNKLTLQQACMLMGALHHITRQETSICQE